MQHTLSEIERILTRTLQEKSIPGMAISIVSKGEKILSKGLGKLNANSAIDVTPDTIFSIMSITKSFTASALVHLQENAEFELNQPVKDFLPYFKTKDGQEARITTQHILSNTAGFPDDLWVVTLLDKYMFEMGKSLPAFQFIFEKYPNIEEVLLTLQTREEVTKYFSTVDSLYEAGEGWTYCTDAYVIAADVLEKVSGISWEAYVQKHILSPLGLKNTYVDPSFIRGEQNVATYQANFGGHLVDLPVPENRVGAPVGFIYSTANDLASYLIAHMSAEDHFISKSGLDLMKQRMAKREKGLSYGLGWKIKQYHHLNVVEHAGGYPGVSCIATMIPKDQLGLVLLSNSDATPVQNIADSIIDVLYGL